MVILASILPTVAAYQLLSLLWPQDGSSQRTRLIRIALAVPVGLALGSIFYVCYRLWIEPGAAGLVLADALFFSLLSMGLGVLNWRRKSGARFIDSSSQPEGMVKPIWYQHVIAALCASASVVTFLNTSIHEPHGRWDAWAMWNMRARFLYRAGEEWPNIFSSWLEWSSPDYPLMLPASIARIWSYAGSELLMGPTIIALVWLITALALVYGVVRHWLGSWKATLAMATLVAAPYFTLHAAAQYADVPLAVCMLAALAMVVMYDQGEREEYRYLVLAGLMASIAAWTKNEGLMFILVLLVSRLAAAIGSGRPRDLLRDLRWLGLGMLPGLSMVMLYKIFLAPPSLFFATQSWGDMANKLTTWVRYAEILPRYGQHLVMFGGGIVVLMVAYIFVYGLSCRRFRAHLGSAVAIILMHLGYVLIYLITPQSIEWHMRTSLDRLLVQLWPMTVLVFVMSVASPDRLWPLERWGRTRGSRNA